MVSNVNPTLFLDFKIYGLPGFLMFSIVNPMESTDFSHPNRMLSIVHPMDCCDFPYQNLMISIVNSTMV